MIEENDILKRLGNRIRKIRKERNLSQERLALICELDRTYIGGIERGERNVAIINIEIIARALNVTLSELMKNL